MQSTETKNRTKQDQQERSEHICPPGVARMLNSPLRTMFENPMRILKPIVKQGDVTVDLGCGGGVFSAALARLVGKDGKVYAVDVQPEMLELTHGFLARRRLAERVTLHRCEGRDLKLDDVQADVVLAVHMVHETPNPEGLVKQIAMLLKDGGKLLVLEPKMHVSEELFQETLAFAQKHGLVKVKDLNTLMGRGALFQKRK